MAVFTPMEQQDNHEDQAPLDNSVIGTMKINPSSYKPIEIRGIIDRTKYAIAGLLFLLRREKSFRNLLVVTALVAGLSVWLEIELIHAVIIFVVMSTSWNERARKRRKPGRVDI